MMITGSSLALQLLANVNSYYLVMILRQISSVGCGRMSKVFANYYYISNVYNINTQSLKWGKSVAKYGRVEFTELRAEERISWSEDSASSMDFLLKMAQ